jgi:Na+/melibiose symporter-like transporter
MKDDRRLTPRLPGLAAYAALRMPLALLELPLFVLLPAFYSQQFGMELALIGAILFGTRLVDALADPLIGAAIDRSRHPAGGWGYRHWLWASLPALAIGFWAMFSPPVDGGLLAVWLALASVLTYLAYSVASIAYQAWGAELGHTERDRARVTGIREAFGLVGVVAASALLAPENAPMLVAGFVVLSALAAIALNWAPGGGRASASDVDPRQATPTLRGTWASVAGNRAFRWLLAAFMLNGVATAIPATLVLFFVRDVLHAEAQVPLFLASYFLAGALGMPLWIALAGRIGLRNAWLLGMAFAVLAFVWALGLERGDVWPFWAVCVLTGLALGADLAMPPALLAAVISGHGDAGRREGAYFGLWNLATKFNLALAAGVGLPLLALFGYVPGASGEAPLSLTLAYAALPSALKLAAGALLLTAPLPERERDGWNERDGQDERDDHDGRKRIGVQS